ncbi:penicillin-binding transpeptidase domain-containing protein [Fibrobacterota bacterium]
MNKARLIFVSFLLAFCFCALIGRLFQIQIYKGSEYAKRCRQQSKLRTLITARRGSIMDRKGRTLAKSISSKRLYPYGDLAGAVLGYIGKDGNGLAGVEYAFDTFLVGEDGWRIVQKDGINNQYSRIGMPKKPPENGNDIYLTIDVQVQKIVEKVLSQTVKRFSAKGGMCIVMDPEAGFILAMANEPSFNPNAWKNCSTGDRSNNCISYNYEPGSTYKIITTAATLQEDVKSEKDVINGNQGKYKIYDQVICDYKPFGDLTFTEALSYSSNVCYAKIASDLGNKRLYKYTRNFGFGSVSGIELPGEETGIVHPVDKWSGRTLVTMAIGQEISATLLQMMVAFSAVANGGILVEPRIIQKIVDSEGSVIKEKALKAKRRVISKDVALRLRRMMKGVVTYGTAKRVALPGLSIAGKTGTSQKIDKETGAYSDNKVWASFIGFAPVEKPAILCGVVIDEPANGEVGGVAAGPAFRQILQQVVSHPNLEYAEKLINAEIFDSCDVQDSDKPHTPQKKLPYICGMSRASVASFLTSEKIPFEIVGTGNRIAYQAPGAGKKFTSDTKLILYTSGSADDEIDTNSVARPVRMPKCTGKDLRDAINALNLKGLVPYVKGTGVVRKQKPAFGVITQSAVICTLVCSFEG